MQDDIIRIDGRTHTCALSGPIDGRIKTVTIKRDAVSDVWVCVACEVEPNTTTANRSISAKNRQSGNMTFCEFGVVFEVAMRNCGCSTKLNLPVTGKTGKVAGIDFGLKTFLTFDNGDEVEVESRHLLKQNAKLLGQANRDVWRKVSGSKSRGQAVRRSNRWLVSIGTLSESAQTGSGRLRRRRPAHLQRRMTTCG